MTTEQFILIAVGATVWTLLVFWIAYALGYTQGFHWGYRRGSQDDRT